MQSIEERSQVSMQPQTVDNALPADHAIEHYIINKALSGDDFCLTYKAIDTQNNIPVIIKEYLPSAFASRNPKTLDIEPISGDSEQDYEWGMAQYFDEASELIAFSHPNIVQIKACIKAHNTAYVITDYIEGIDLETYSNRSTRSEEALLSLLVPLLSGLQAIHNKGFLHSDLTPSNILIQERTKAPIIMNLGDVKHIFRNRKKEIAHIVSPGYSAYEQYHTHTHQGAWTDIYAMGCILYRIISGKPPESSMARLAATVDNCGQDILIPATEAGKDRYSKTFLSAIDHAIELQRADRPESIHTWLEEFKINGQPLILPESKNLEIEPFSLQEEINPASQDLHIDFNLDTQPSNDPTKHYRVIAAMVVSMIVTIGGGAYYYQSRDNNNLEEYADLSPTSFSTPPKEASAPIEPIVESTQPFDTVIDSDFNAVTHSLNSSSVIDTQDTATTKSDEPELGTHEDEVKPENLAEVDSTENSASNAPTVTTNTNTTEDSTPAASSTDKNTEKNIKTSTTKNKKTNNQVATNSKPTKTNKHPRKNMVKQQLNMDKKDLYRLLRPPKQHNRKHAKAKTKYQIKWEAKQRQEEYRAEWKKKKLVQQQRQNRIKQQQEIRKSKKNVKQLEETLIGDKDW